MKILIINHNGGSLYHGPNLRTYYAAKELVRRNHEVTIASSSYSHKYSVLPVIKGGVTPEVIDGIKYKWIKCVHYKGLLKRIYSHFEFGIKLIFWRRKIVNEVDLIIFSGPPPEIFIFAWALSKIYKSPIVSDIRDHWPLTQIEMNRFQLLNPYVYFLYLCQLFMIKGSDVLASPLPGSTLYLRSIGAKAEIIIIENGYDTSRTADNKPLFLRVHACSSSIGFEAGSTIRTQDIASINKFIVGYAGAFDRDNDLDTLIDAATHLNDRDDVIFLFVGAGLSLNKLIEAAKRLTNILVIERVLSHDVPKVLDIMSICYCGLRPKNIYKYGVSLAKSYEYMAARKPILWSIDAYNNPIKESGGGLSVEPGNVPELVSAIDHFSLLDKSELNTIGNKGYRYLEDHFSYKVLGERWQSLVDKFT